jgi:flagellar P-ring protein precursor FlgI
MKFTISKTSVPGCLSVCSLYAVILIAMVVPNLAGAQGELPPPLQVVAPRPFVPPSELRVQISDITTIKGQMGSTLSGLGLVVGLNGTGGKSAETRRMAANWANRFGGIVDAQNNAKSQSAVMVTATLPAFAREGELITVQVSVFDDATSLKGGTLLLTHLEGVDGQVYAQASGPLLGSGFSVSGNAASVQKNHPTTASVSAQVVREVCLDGCIDQGILDLLLINKDALTASRIANSINQLFPGRARSMDAGMVRVQVPEPFQQSRNDFIAMLGSLAITPNVPARVVINQKTGTIVIGSRVRLSRVVFANDNLIVTTSESPAVSQPNALSGGETVVVPRTQITAVEEGGQYNILSEGIEVGEFAAALNAMGVSPQDLITIFQSLKSSGALHAELVFE